ncbi:RHS repeat-associated core domain-containing protein [Streptomyces cylindrosporus]|uniref:HNH endonuclease n=1 Tax=Streptomyces cylindrosporus TaxID=2927583 RepID=A0ABS9XZC4_9ACTN|nr:RHS repeat-associated core domain-containing protein [Streptomyces cylindrosporus]MCI3270320.1 HNH endonuclease [Streptomyces cylindrosporus]
MKRFRSSCVAAVVLALGLSGLQPVVAEAAPRGTTSVADAERSVTTIDRTKIRAGARFDTRPTDAKGRPLAAAEVAKVTWPSPGEDNVAVGAKPARVAATAVSVTAPRSRAAAPDTVDVRAYDNAKARQLGGHATAFTLKAAETTDRVGVRVDTSGFRRAFGADFESRLRLIAKPACALSTPRAAKCAASSPVKSRIDLTTHTLSAELAADPDTVFVVAAAPNGETGSATATKLASSSKWQVGLSSGDFSWSLPLPQVPAIAGDAPDINLGYSSQAVDGMVAAENNQPSWVGQGWDLALPYIERRYNGCADDGGDTGDLCWAGDEYRISLQGTSSALVKDTTAGGDTWRAQDDPGWRVQHRTGAENGDNDGEYWVVTTPQGTQYTFGRGKQATTGTATDSVYTVPVFGDDEGEPCHKGSVEDSYCTQAWRWNLDGVVDAHGNSNTYFYAQETNRYARNGDPDKSTSYVRGGHLKDIVYSQRSGAEDQQAPARLHFTTGLRCVEAADGSGDCPAFDADHASSYPDAPLDSLCASGDCTGEEQKAPTFFTNALLRSVTAQRSGADGGWTDVDRMDFTYDYPKPSDGTDAMLWLSKVQQTGLVGGELKLPAVEFTGKEFANRADADPAAGAPEMRKLRITSFLDELGRRVDVTYGQPDPCPIDDLPEGRYDSNTQDCFPGWRTNGTSSGFGVWHKYLTTEVTVRDSGGGSPPQTTEYRYRGTPAWHHDDDPVTKAERRSWSDWRGYGSVDVAKMTDPSYRGESASRAVQITRSLNYRGMDGDAKADGSHKSVEVTDSQGNSVKDLPYLKGKERESVQFQVNADGSAGYELGGTLHGYTSAHTTPAKEGESDPDKDAHLVVENSSTSRETLIADNGDRSTRTTTLATDYDTYGQVTQVLDTAGDDVRCTKTSYDRGAAAVDSWTLAFPYRIRTYSGTCADPKSLITGKDQYYDGSTDLGAPVTKGDVTRSVAAVAASGPDTVTKTETTEATFDAYGRTATQTDAKGNTDRTVYSPDTGRPVTVTETNALGQAEVTTFEADRQLPVSVKDANGQITRNSYDPLGRLISVRQPEQGADDPPAQVFTYFLDPEHVKPPRVTTANLQSGDTYVTTWQYLDSLGRNRQTQQVSPASTGGTDKTIVTDKRYDDAGNVAAESLPVVAAGAAGSALLAVPGDQVDETRYTYDSLGRTLEAAQYGNGKRLWATTTEYFGDRTRTTPPHGGVPSTAWTDARGRGVRKQEGTGNTAATTTYTYTPADQTASVTDPGGHTSTFGYDLLGRRTEAVDADAGRMRTEYDANGNPVASWDAKALAAGSDTPTLSTEYDKLNRPVSRWTGRVGSGTKVASWAYDSTDVPNAVGHVTTQTTYQDGRAYTLAATGFDPRGRITGKKWTFPKGLGGLLKDTSYRVEYGYDASDHVVRTSYPDAAPGTPKETLTTGYDSLGNPTTLTGTITDPLTGEDHTRSYISGTGYAADGKLATRDYADALHPLRRAYGYEDDTHRLSRIQTLVGSAHDDSWEAKQDDGYAWDQAGNLTSITDNALKTPVATCYTYDGLDRLAHAWTTERTDCSDDDSTTVHDGPAGYNESWTYSADGNITSARSLLLKQDYAYEDPDHPHAVTQVGHDTYAYDADGALKKKVKDLVPASYEWDAQQRLASVTTALLKKTDFVYAPDGTRIARIDPLGVATLYLDDQEITVALGILKGGTRYYRLAGTAVAERLPAGILKWRFNDTQGSAQIAVPEGTGLVERAYYDPYGKIRDPLLHAPPTDRGWLGKVRDPSTGLNALDARYYDADLGRFVSTDPALDLTSAQTANAYSYGADNPVMFVDPTGLWSLSGVWNSVKEGASDAWNWAKENKGVIANVAVGIAVGIAVGAVCSTGVGCVILAGAVAGAAGAATGYSVDAAEGKTDFSVGGLLTATGVGAVTGAATAGALAGLGAGARAALNSSAGKAVTSAASRAVSGGSGKAISAVTGAAARAGKAIANSKPGSKIADIAKGIANTARKITGGKPGSGLEDGVEYVTKRPGFTPTPGRGGAPGSRPYMKFTPAGKDEVLQRNASAQSDGIARCANPTCNVPLTKAQQSRSGVTPRSDEAAVDHIEPQAHGGSGDPSNGQGLCRVCNGDKSDGPAPWGP